MDRSDLTVDSSPSTARDSVGIRPTRSLARSDGRTRWSAAILVLCGVALVGSCATTSRAPVAAPSASSSAAITYDGLDASLWLQSAEESRVLRESTYAAAGRALVEALADPGRGLFAAATEPPRPPAVILDLDETVLDNSAYNARLTARGERFGPATWTTWVEAAEAKAVPGVLEFARLAAAHGVTLFFVSNRDAPMEAATRRNLAALGLPVSEAPDNVLLRGELPEWGSDKSSRYARVAESHRVLVLIGDDLNDFVPLPREATPATRRELVEPYRDRFGRDWFLLPNPVHGSWMRAALAARPEGEPGRTDTARKLDALEIFTPAASPP